jgi:hypothetical protein
MLVATIGTASSLGSIEPFDRLLMTSSIFLETAARKVIRVENMHEHYHKKTGSRERESFTYS